MAVSYADFVAGKFRALEPVGVDVGHDWRSRHLFDFQSDLVRWALRRGRAAIFADTGLGKTRMQLTWAFELYRRTAANVLILAPLAVAAQTQREGASIGIDVALCREQCDVTRGINITNYDRLHKFDPSAFDAIVLDESSIIKHHDAKTFSRLIEAFRDTPYRLCATATPAPNDWTELGTHAEFLGVCSRTEMLAEFFVHDGGETSVWRLKGHARHEFWRWIAQWGALIRKPSDLGYDDHAYDLPPLNVTQHLVDTKADAAGMLFAMEAQTLMERRDARRASLAERVAECAAMVNADRQPWIVWCDLNAEGDALKAAIPDAVEIRGADEAETKERRLTDFAEGRIRVLVTKPSIAGFGLNWQHCSRMAFVGVTDSFEAYYQALRRCWRFGQDRPVNVHIFASELEGSVIANLARKERDALAMSEAMSAETHDAVIASVRGTSRQSNPYNPTHPIALPDFLRRAA